MLIANYNNGQFIDDAIRSVLLQTLTDWQLVIVDDGSTDDSVTRIKAYLNDDRIEMYAREKNEGYTKSLIFGLTKINSEIVGILDSDDALVPDAIEKAHFLHRTQPELGLVLSQALICDDDLTPLYATTNMTRRLAEPLIYWRGPTAFRTFKMSAYARTEGFNPRLLYAEDLDIVLKLEEAAPVSRINEPIYMYRQLPLSQSKEKNRRHVSLRSVGLAFYRAYLRRRHSRTPNLPTDTVSSWMIAGVRYSLELGQRMSALAFAARALRIAPFEAAVRRAAWQALSSRFPSESLDRRFLPVFRFESSTGNRSPDRITCIPLLHKPGHALFGYDQLILRDGNYRALFELRIKGYSFAANPIAVLDVYENLKKKEVLAQRTINVAEAGNKTELFCVDFLAQQGDRVELRVFWNEQCVLEIFGIVLEHVGSNPA